MDVQAIIMAGGEGVRLRPMTVHWPKPLVPLAGEPVMGYSLKLLKTHGITDVGATLWYRPGDIRAAFGRGEAYGVRLRYYEETVPLGTAGSVKLAKEHLKGTFIVLSGDGLTDCDLSAAVAFHQEKRALATLVLKRVQIPLPYGVVMCDREQRIIRFIEKPVWSRVFSNLVNTGIYILEPEIFAHIPDRGAPDFGKDIFPALVAGGLPVYGYETAAYWCDVGDLNAYLTAQTALLRGETAFSVLPGQDASARVDESARLEGECLIGKDAVIGPGALIRNAVIGRGCVVGAGAVIEHSCLWDGACAGEKARLSSCVLCFGAAARKGAEISGGCVLGEGAVAGEDARLLPGVKLWPHVRALPGAAVHRSLLSGDRVLPQWTAEGAVCDAAEEACRLADAFAAEGRLRHALLSFSGGGEALASVAGGALAARGVRVLSAGEMTFPMAQRLVAELMLDGGVFLAGGHMMRFISAGGVPAPPQLSARIDARIMRPEGKGEAPEKGEVVPWTGAEEIYLARTLPRGAKPLLSPVAVFCPAGPALPMIRRGLERMRAGSVRFLNGRDMRLRPGETGFALDDGGAAVAVATEEGALSEEQTALLLLKLFFRAWGRLYRLPGTPEAAAALSPLLPADDGEACRAQRFMMRDGIAALFMICGALKEGPLAHWTADLPETHFRVREVPCQPRDKGRILRALCEETTLPHTLEDGLRVRHENGYATIAPDGYQNAVRIVSESWDSEFAGELCDFYLEKIRRMTRSNTP